MLDRGRRPLPGEPDFDRVKLCHCGSSRNRLAGFREWAGATASEWVRRGVGDTGISRQELTGDFGSLSSWAQENWRCPVWENITSQTIKDLATNNPTKTRGVSRIGNQWAPNGIITDPRDGPSNHRPSFLGLLFGRQHPGGAFILRYTLSNFVRNILG